MSKYFGSTVRFFVVMLLALCIIVFAAIAYYEYTEMNAWRNEARLMRFEAKSAVAHADEQAAVAADTVEQQCRALACQRCGEQVMSGDYGTITLLGRLAGTNGPGTHNTFLGGGIKQQPSHPH